MVGFGKKLKHLFSKKTGHIEEVWHFRVDSEVLSGTVSRDIDNDGAEEVLFGTKKGELYCLGTTGNPKWKFNVHENIDFKEAIFYDPESMNTISSVPLAEVLEGNQFAIVFGSELGYVYCLNAAGQLVWKYKAGDAVRGDIVCGNMFSDTAKDIVFGCTDGYLYVLSSRGKLRWKIKAKSPIESTPYVCVQSQQILFGTDDGTIYSVDYQGKLLWGYKTKGKITAQPKTATLEGTNELYTLVGSYDGTLYVFEQSGNLKWTFATAGPIVSSVFVADVNGDGKKEIFFGSCDNKVYALNYQGDKLWDYETNFWVVNTPIASDIDSDGIIELLVGSYDTMLYVLDSRGSYELDYVPGLSGVVHQAGHYSDIMTQEPGKLQGKKLWEYPTSSVVVGLTYNAKSKSIIIADKIGEIHAIQYREDS